MARSALHASEVLFRCSTWPDPTNMVVPSVSIKPDCGQGFPWDFPWGLKWASRDLLYVAHVLTRKRKKKNQGPPAVTSQAPREHRPQHPERRPGLEPVTGRIRHRDSTQERRHQRRRPATEPQGLRTCSSRVQHKGDTHTARRHKVSENVRQSSFHRTKGRRVADSRREEVRAEGGEGKGAAGADSARGDAALCASAARRGGRGADASWATGSSQYTNVCTNVVRRLTCYARREGTVGRQVARPQRKDREDRRAAQVRRQVTGKLARVCAARSSRTCLQCNGVCYKGCKTANGLPKE